MTEKFETDYWTLMAMDVYGGSFVKSIALAARHADDSNYRKLKNAFSEYWEHYTEMGRKLMEKERE